MDSASTRRLRVLTLSDMYPQQHRPQYALFVEQQTKALADYCDTVVVSPTRIFPPLNIVRNLPSLNRVRAAWQAWRNDVDETSEVEQYNGLTVYHPRYTAPPKEVHGIWGLFAYPAILPLLRRLHAEQPFDIIHAHNAAPNGLIGLLARRWMKVPLAITVHGFDLTYSIRQNPVSRKAIEMSYQGADAVFANGRWAAKTLVSHGVAPDKVHVVYLGANGDMPVTPPNLLSKSPADSPFRLLTVARLVELKGIQWMLRALRQLLDEGLKIHYTIVGDGEYRGTLEALSQSLGLTNVVTFTGAIPRSAIWEHYAACDLFVMPSHVETFGIVYVEALSQGKPIIGCTTGGAADIHNIYSEGVELTPPHDVAELVMAVKRWMQDPARRQRVQQTAPRLVAERFTWERTASEIMALYHTLLNRPPLQVKGTGVLNP